MTAMHEQTEYLLRGHKRLFRQHPAKKVLQAHIRALQAENVRLAIALRASLERMESDLDTLESELGQNRSLLEIEEEGDLPGEVMEARALLAELEAQNG